MSGCAFHLLEFQCEIIIPFNWIIFFGHLFVGNNAIVSDKFFVISSLMGKEKSNKNRWLELSPEIQKGKPKKGQKMHSPQSPEPKEVES